MTMCSLDVPDVSLSSPQNYAIFNPRPAGHRATLTLMMVEVVVVGLK